ncbi:TPA: DUF1642 domain-containing protein [Streptococcus suis]
MEQKDFYEVNGCNWFIPVDLIEENKCTKELEVVATESGRITFVPSIYKFLKPPEQQKVVVPKFVAEWIEKHKNNNGKKDRLSHALEHVFDDVEVGLYIKQQEGDYTETIARAWLDGYEIEKEKQWVVKDDTGYLSYLQFSIPNIYQRETSLDKNDAYKFKNRSRADLFAELVTGTVEEVE